jgi:hypothetical protein
MYACEGGDFDLYIDSLHGKWFPKDLFPVPLNTESKMIPEANIFLEPRQRH